MRTVAIDTPDTNVTDPGPFFVTVLDTRGEYERVVQRDILATYSDAVTAHNSIVESVESGALPFVSGIIRIHRADRFTKSDALLTAFGPAN